MMPTLCDCCATQTQNMVPNMRSKKQKAEPTRTKPNINGKVYAYEKCKLRATKRRLYRHDCWQKGVGKMLSYVYTCCPEDPSEGRIKKICNRCALAPLSSTLLPHTLSAARATEWPADLGHLGHATGQVVPSLWDHW